MRMDKVNLKQVTGQSQEERDADTRAALENSNPELASQLNQLLARAMDRKVNEFVITPEMKEGATENEAFQKPRQQGE